MGKSHRTITITAMDRQSKLHEMLASLVNCDLSGWHVYAFVEPGPMQADMAGLLADILPNDQLSVTLNAERLGIRENPHTALNCAFASGSDFNLCLEEDFILAPDALRLAEWYHRNHRRHWAALNLMAGTCGSAGNLSDPTYPMDLFESRCFNSIGVGFTKSDWAQAARCFGTPERQRDENTIFDLGWDWALFGQILMTPERRVIHPVAARCTHDGAGGTYCNADFQKQAFGGIKLAHEKPIQSDFQLTEIDALPASVAKHAICQQDLANLHLDAMMREGVELPTPAAYVPPIDERQSTGILHRIKHKLSPRRRDRRTK